MTSNTQLSAASGFGDAASDWRFGETMSEQPEAGRPVCGNCGATAPAEWDGLPCTHCAAPTQQPAAEPDAHEYDRCFYPERWPRGGIAPCQHYRFDHDKADGDHPFTEPAPPAAGDSARDAELRALVAKWRERAEFWRNEYNRAVRDEDELSAQGASHSQNAHEIHANELEAVLREASDD